MSRHKVEISGVNTANIKVLTNVEMRELFLKMQNGDPFARDDLVNGNLKLVLSILKRFGNTSENMKIIALKEFEDDGRRMVSLDNLIQWASYEAQIPENNLVNKTLGILNFEDLRYTVEKCLSSSDLFVEKKTKKGILKQVNYRDSIKDAKIINGKFVFILKTGQSDVLPAFRADEFLKYLALMAQKEELIFEIKRLSFFDETMTEV